MPARKGIQRTESIYEKIRRAESPRFFRAKRFGAPNLFANRFNALNPFVSGHMRSLKYKMLSSGNILEALHGEPRSDASPERGQATKGNCIAIIGVNEQVEIILCPLPLYLSIFWLL